MNSDSLQMTETPAVVPQVDPAIAPSKATLFLKIAKAMGTLQRLKEAGWNSYHEYNYARISDVADAARKALSEAGLALLPDMVSFNQEIVQRPGKNSAVRTLYRTQAAFDFTLACGETGATYTCRWYAEAEDESDKGINKVASAAEKYFLLKLLLISTGDEPDTDSEGEPVQRATNKQTRTSNNRQSGNGAPQQAPPQQQPQFYREGESGEKISVKYDLSAVRAGTRFMYDNDIHHANSVDKLVTEGVILDTDSTATAIARVVKHRAQKDFNFDEGMMKEALQAAQPNIQSYGAWIGAGHTPEQAWTAIKDYAELAKLPPAQPNGNGKNPLVDYQPNTGTPQGNEWRYVTKVKVSQTKKHTPFYTFITEDYHVKGWSEDVAAIKNAGYDVSAWSDQVSGEFTVDPILMLVVKRDGGWRMGEVKLEDVSF